MNEEQIEKALSKLSDPTVASAVAEALGYARASSINHACSDGRIPGAWKAGGTWLIPVNGIKEALKSGKLRPGWKSTSDPQ
jgi:hypothetical protein